MARRSNNNPVLTTAGELQDDIKAALTDKAKGMDEHAICPKHGVTKERLRRAIKTPQGSQLMRRIKREMKLPDRLGKDELLYKIQKWIEKEEVKEEAKLPDLVGAAMNYARLAGYLGKETISVSNTTVVAGSVSFSSLLQGIAERQQARLSSDSASSEVVDV